MKAGGRKGIMKSTVKIRQAEEDKLWRDKELKNQPTTILLKMSKLREYQISFTSSKMVNESVQYLVTKNNLSISFTNQY